MTTTTLPFTAAVFDLDGVITRTAGLHCKAWKEMFDNFLMKYTTRENRAFAPFTEADYLAYVDGKPRYEGVESFLASRAIALPFGDPADEPARAAPEHPPAGALAAAREGFGIALLNPKIALFFLALFSQFVSSEAGAIEVAILAGTATLVDASWYALVATGLTARATAAWLRRHGRWIERLSGAALVFLALTTAASTL